MRLVLDFKAQTTDCWIDGPVQPAREEPLHGGRIGCQIIAPSIPSRLFLGAKFHHPAANCLIRIRLEGDHSHTIYYIHFFFCNFNQLIPPSQTFHSKLKQINQNPNQVCQVLNRSPIHWNQGPEQPGMMCIYPNHLASNIAYPVDKKNIVIGYSILRTT